MTDFKHELDIHTQEGWKILGGPSGWRPSMAYPFFVGWGLRKAKCGCGRVFKNKEDFEAHYLYKAIWELESNVLPSEWREVRRESQS